jgi:hypothetical protein
LFQQLQSLFITGVQFVGELSPEAWTALATRIPTNAVRGADPDIQGQTTLERPAGETTYTQHSACVIYTTPVESCGC